MLLTSVVSDRLSPGSTVCCPTRNQRVEVRPRLSRVQLGSELDAHPDPYHYPQGSTTRGHFSAVCVDVDVRILIFTHGEASERCRKAIFQPYVNFAPRPRLIKSAAPPLVLRGPVRPSSLATH